MDRNEFAKEFMLMEQAFEKPSTDGKRDIYFDKFKAMSGDAFKALVSRALDECDKFPTIPELNKLAGLGQKMVAMAGWNELMEIRDISEHAERPMGAVHPRQPGELISYDPEIGTVYYLPDRLVNQPLLYKAFKLSIGSWQDFCAEKVTDFQKRNFLDSYGVILAQASGKPELPAAKRLALVESND